MRGKLIQIACQYDDTVLRNENRYSACFNSKADCLQSPIWKVVENNATFTVTGAMGYSCHFLVSKQTGQTIKFIRTDMGE